VLAAGADDADDESLDDEDDEDESDDPPSLFALEDELLPML
jgi:hypothetical protein